MVPFRTNSYGATRHDLYDVVCRERVGPWVDRAGSGFLSDVLRVRSVFDFCAELLAESIIIGDLSTVIMRNKLITIICVFFFMGYFSNKSQ